MDTGFTLDTGRKLDVQKTPGRLLNVLCMFNLRPVPRGYLVRYFPDLLFLITPFFDEKKCSLKNSKPGGVQRN